MPRNNYGASIPPQWEEIKLELLYTLCRLCRGGGGTVPFVTPFYYCDATASPAAGGREEGEINIRRTQIRINQAALVLAAEAAAVSTMHQKEEGEKLRALKA